MTKKKASPEFWTQQDTEFGKKWFANIGPVRLAVIEPFDSEQQGRISYASFISHETIQLKEDETLEDAKQMTLTLIEQLLTLSLEEIKKLPENNY